MVSFIRFEFEFIFFVFLLSTYCDVQLLSYDDYFIRCFYADDSNYNIVSIRRIKYLFVNMFHKI